jgi:ubiquitin conjugation factor E4 B
MSHYGILRTISTYSDLAKHLEEMQRHLDILQGDGSWMGVRNLLDFEWPS